MTTSGPSVALVPVLPEFTTAERLALGRADLLSWVGTLLSTSLDADVPLRDVQEAASHADPRATTRYDRARASPGPARYLHRRRLRPRVLMVDRLAHHM